MIEVSALTKRYGPKTVVDRLTFAVQPGKVTGFLGPNGSGKSTTMRLIMGLDHPDAGSTRVAGRPYRELAWPLREVGAMLDAKAFHPGRSARSHLLGLAAANAIGNRRVDEVLDVVGLTSVAAKRTGTFSLGMGQRLGIAAALLGDPGIVLLDEPVNGLDPEGIRWVRSLVRGMATEGRTVFLSSHLISEMALTADELVVIGQGRLVAQLSMAELASRGPQSVRVRASDPGATSALGRILSGHGLEVTVDSDDAMVVAGADPGFIAVAASGAGIVLHELTPQRLSLEEVFMALTAEHVEFRMETNERVPAMAAAGTRRNS